MPSPFDPTSQSHLPACHIKFPAEAEHRSAAFYLAAEEYVAQTFPCDDYLFSWQLGRTVVMGRNQVAHAEFDLDFCREEGIEVVRRKSGGGAIFADERNIMWSLITGEGAVEPLFSDYAQTVASALTKLGVNASVSGRNDILLENGGKVCGNAFYHLPHRNIVHATMLYDTDTRLMEGALTPSSQKMTSKGVKSVRSRVSLLKDFLPYGVSELRVRLTTLLTDREISLTADDVAAIEEIERGYHDPAYLYGSSSHSDVCYERYIPSCGTLHVDFRLQGTIIESVSLTGDFFEMADAKSAFQKAFVGCVFSPSSLKVAITDSHPERSIRGLSENDLQQLLQLEL